MGTTWLTALAGAALVLVSLTASVARSERTAAAFAVSRCEREVSRLERRMRWLEVSLSERLADPALRAMAPAVVVDDGEAGLW